MNKALRLDYQETGIAGNHTIASVMLASPALIRQGDSRLRPFMEATSAEDSDKELERLVAEAMPIIKGIIKSKLHVSLHLEDGSRENQDALEINCEAQVDLIAALRKLQAGRRSFINSFESYVAVLAYNACYNHLRRKHPRRHSLKNKLRYLLTHRMDFSVWEIEGVLFCGLTTWRFQKRAPAGSGALRRSLAASSPFHQLKSSGMDARALALPDLVSVLFRQLSGPVELDELVCVVADLQELKEEKTLTESEREELSGASFNDTPQKASANPAQDFERRLYLERLWSEICQLPARQRAALLLNLRDSQGNGCSDGVNLFPITGVASLRQMALALEMPAEELAVLWNELPLDDARIAGKLNVTRQQVINLRKSARERLSRRMKALW